MLYALYFIQARLARLFLGGLAWLDDSMGALLIGLREQGIDQAPVLPLPLPLTLALQPSPNPKPNLSPSPSRGKRTD